MNFPTLESYLIWRTQWRAEYKTLSEAIRENKNIIPIKMRAGDFAGEYQVKLIEQRLSATEMLEERKTSKETARAAWEQWPDKRPRAAAA